MQNSGSKQHSNCDEPSLEPNTPPGQSTTWELEQRAIFHHHRSHGITFNPCGQSSSTTSFQIGPIWPPFDCLGQLLFRLDNGSRSETTPAKPWITKKTTPPDCRTTCQNEIPLDPSNGMVLPPPPARVSFAARLRCCFPRS